MTGRLEESIIRDLLASGATGDPGAPLKQGLSPQELADGIPHSEKDIQVKLKKLASFSVEPVEKTDKNKYRLESASEGRQYLADEGCSRDPKNWSGLSGQ
jgi:hypothetical protein